MKDIKSIFDEGELNTLYSTFSMFKYGIEDEYRMLRIISSPIFKNLNDSIYNAQIISVNKSLPDRYKLPSNLNIEDTDVQLKALKIHAKKCIEMYKGASEGNWLEWSEDAKKDMIINLASPYQIQYQTINKILTENE